MKDVPKLSLKSIPLIFLIFVFTGISSAGSVEHWVTFDMLPHGSEVAGVNLSNGEKD